MHLHNNSAPDLYDAQETMELNSTKSAFEMQIPDLTVEDFCQEFAKMSLVVTVPLMFVVASVGVGDLVLIINSFQRQQPNSKPVHLPTVCFASGNLLNVIILLYFQFYFTITQTYSCGIVKMTQQFQILVLAFFCLHLLAATIRFCIVMCRSSVELAENVPSPQIRTIVVVIWFQGISHSFCVLINLFALKHTPSSLNLVTFCLLLIVPALTVLLFVLSRAMKSYRRMRRYREWNGGEFIRPPRTQDCLIFKWILMTACTVLLFWLPFWTKNIFDYFKDPNSALEAFDFYTWIVVDILLLSNSLLIHLI